MEQTITLVANRQELLQQIQSDYLSTSILSICAFFLILILTIICYKIIPKFLDDDSDKNYCKILTFRLGTVFLSILSMATMHNINSYYNPESILSQKINQAKSILNAQ